MKSRILICVTVMTLFPALALPVRVRLAAQEQQQQRPPKLQRYKLTVLGTLGGSVGTATGINNRGDLVGGSALPGNNSGHAVLYKKNRLIDLGTLDGGSQSFTFTDPNDKDEVSGYSDTSTPDPNGEDFCLFGDHLICLAFLCGGTG